MKNWKILLTVIVLILVVIIAVISKKPKSTISESAIELPPSEGALVDPQEKIPEDNYKINTPLSENKIIHKNGMKIEITNEGQGEEIVNGQIAVVNYVGMLENGTVFDASKNHGNGTFSFPLGAGQVIKGWDQGVVGMKIGESRTLTIPPELAYGPNGVSPIIPPNSTLIFNVTLLDIR